MLPSHSGLDLILLPKGMGGGELTIPESQRVIEEVAEGPFGRQPPRWFYAVCLFALQTHA